jgi:predicted ATPase
MDRSALVVPEALLEREHEVERVRGALRAVGQQAGVALVVEGAAGIGKSRLLDVARVRATELGLRVLSARATELEQGFPFDVTRQLFERTLMEADTGQRERWLAGAAALAADVITSAPTSAGALKPGAGAGDPSYAWQHGLYWLSSNLAADSPLVVLVDDLQWCDAPSARALAFIARRVEGQPLGLILATRPLDPARTPEAATLVADPAAELLRLAPLTQAAVGALIAVRLRGEPDDRFVQACLEVTGGNPFLVGELLAEAAARGLGPTAAAAAEIRTIVPSGVVNAVLLRLARLAPQAATLARALSVLGDGTQVGDAARLAALEEADLEASIAALASAGIVEPGGVVRFAHPILRTAIYGDLSPAESERLPRAATRILRERGAPARPGRGAGHAPRARR